MKTTRHIGNCQICEADQKVRNGLMVHHGYERPGDGYIVGDCYGVYKAPYEVSCEDIKAWKLELAGMLEGAKVYLARLQNNEVTTFHEEEYTNGYGKPKVRVTYKVETTEKYKWAELLRSRVWGAESKVRSLETLVARCEKRIAEWTAQPVRTIEEEQAKERAAKAERDALVAAKRAAKQAKVDATKAKQADLEARRQAIKDDFSAQFKALAATPESTERMNAACALAVKMTKKKYSFFWVRELNIDDTIIQLGLASRPDPAHPLYVKYSAVFN